jgi:Mlc titration factor MtfA (ptsG expression regulator)
VFQREYETLQWLVDAGASTLIDPYGASAPEEFFAVASETFFMQPQALAQQHPALFAQLARYYDLDPRAWI